MGLKRNIRRGISLIIFCLVLVVLFGTDSSKEPAKEYVLSDTEIIGQELEWELICSQLPVFRYLLYEKNGDNEYEQYVLSWFPLYQHLFAREVLSKVAINRNELAVGAELEKGILEENANVSAVDNRSKMEPAIVNVQGGEKSTGKNGEETGGIIEGGQPHSVSENQLATVSENNMEHVQDSLDTSQIFLTASDFAPTSEKQYEYDWDTYTDMEKVRKEFFAIDATTEIEDARIDPQILLEKDVSISEGNGGPQILIYHTHSQETFADSIPGDENTGIMGAGEYLTGLLQDTYGYEVLHHTGEYDVESRDYAYSNALPNIESILKEYPSIEVVIDLHRDAVAEGTKLVSQQKGKTAAQVMFFNGLSHTIKQGDISYLENLYIDDNLAFSFQMQTLCNEYYPGLTRRIYLKGYRYNMHLRPKTLLIELGAQTNTCEEVRNTLDIIAHVLHMCLSEKN